MIDILQKAAHHAESIENTSINLEVRVEGIHIRAMRDSEYGPTYTLIITSYEFLDNLIMDIDKCVLELDRYIDSMEPEYKTETTLDDIHKARDEFKSKNYEYPTFVQMPPMMAMDLEREISERGQMFVAGNPPGKKGILGMEIRHGNKFYVGVD